MYVSKKHDDWDEYLPYVVLAYNTVAQDSTGFAPFTLLYGFEARIPTDVSSAGTSSDPELRFERLQEARDLAYKANKAAQVIQQEQYNKRHHAPPEYKIGEKVLIYRPRGYIGQTSKLRHTWEGPFEIVSRSSAILYLVTRVKPMTRRPREEWVNIKRMKLYHERAL